MKRKHFMVDKSLHSSKEIEDKCTNDNNDKEIYPYIVDSNDHCETPNIAYVHLRELLSSLGKDLGKTIDTLSIYDPFFCEGSMVERFSCLGFNNVYNRKEDFYAMQIAGSIPDYDVLVTNPPYSGDHVELLLKFCVASGKPFCILVPNYVYAKDYYSLALSIQPSGGTVSMFFIVPNKRYQYTTPKGRRQEKSAKVTSPFPTFWFCHVPPHHRRVLDTLYSGSGSAEDYRLCRSLNSLPLDVLAESDPRKRKQRNAEKRAKHKKRKKQKQLVDNAVK